jgi:hypothetical protein
MSTRNVNRPRAPRRPRQAKIMERISRNIPDTTDFEKGVKHALLNRPPKWDENNPERSKGERRARKRHINLANIVKRAPRMDWGNGQVEDYPYQGFQEHVRQEHGRIMASDFEHFTAIHRDAHGREHPHYIRPKVTYKTTYAKKDKDGGCKYGSYREGDHIYCLSNPNHHALANPDPIKHANAMKRTEEHTSVSSHSTQPPATRQGTRTLPAAGLAPTTHSRDNTTRRPSGIPAPTQREKRKSEETPSKRKAPKGSRELKNLEWNMKK